MLSANRWIYGRYILPKSSLKGYPLHDVAILNTKAPLYFSAF